MADTEYLFHLRDEADGKPGPAGKIKLDGWCLSIQIEGYGECTAEPEEAYPIVLEFYEGKLQLLVWKDVNDEEPTKIDMQGALESLHKE